MKGVDNMKIIKCSDRLPKEGKYVLIHASTRPWGDSTNTIGLFWKVAKLVKGISEETRQTLKEEYERTGINVNYEEVYGWNLSKGYHYTPRHLTYRSGDEFGNNEVPYIFDEFGPDRHLGQDVKYWCELPILKGI